MFSELYTRTLAWCQVTDTPGQHSETYIQVPVVPPGVRFNFTITPGVPYEAMIIHRFSYGDILPGIFRVWAGQKGMTYHTGLLTPDIMSSGIDTWLIITNRDSLYFGLRNEDVVNHYFEAYIWHLNILKIDPDLEKIKKAVERMIVPGIITPPYVVPAPFTPAGVR